MDSSTKLPTGAGISVPGPSVIPAKAGIQGWSGGLQVRKSPVSLTSLILVLTSPLSRLVIIATAVLLAASVAQLIVQASVVFESSLPAVFGGPVWDLLLDTEWGRLWLWRVALGTASGVAAVVAWRRGDSLTLAILSVALGAGALLTISLTSHAAATVNVRTEAILNDFIHLVSVAVWVGGLCGLVAGGATHSESLRQLGAT